MDIKNTDKGNALRFVEFYNGEVKYVNENKEFVRWNEEGGWTNCDPFILADDVIQDIYAKASEIDDAKERSDLVEHGLKLEGTMYIENMLEQVKHYSNILIDLFDSNPTVINCGNGIVNLKTKVLYHHSPEHLHFNKAIMPITILVQSVRGSINF
jgi:phage/plasmid-associated DNA primase